MWFDPVVVPEGPAVLVKVHFDRDDPPVLELFFWLLAGGVGQGDPEVQQAPAGSQDLLVLLVVLQPELVGGRPFEEVTEKGKKKWF